MVQKNVKFDNGDKVVYEGAICGKVTAIHIRGKNEHTTGDEFSYIKEGDPSSNTVEEYEIALDKDSKGLGFNKHDYKKPLEVEIRY